MRVLRLEGQVQASDGHPYAIHQDVAFQGDHEGTKREIEQRLDACLRLHGVTRAGPIEWSSFEIML